MDVVQRLLDAGFSRVLVLDGKTCGIAEPTLVLALISYTAELTPSPGEAWIHPYYFASQRAYLIASSLVREPEAAEIGLKLRDEIRVKPIFARLPILTQGRNTLSYCEELGSRFHVQIFTLDRALTPNVSLLPEPKPLHCGACTRCMEACPTHAIGTEGFHRERCLRNWQLGGKAVPEELRGLMGSRFIGCDECQRCCPHNPEAAVHASPSLSLQQMLGNAKQSSALLSGLIGANLALPNRVLAQAILLAGCSGSADLLPLLEPLCCHPSPVVAEHAAWACDQLKGKEASC